MSQTPAPPIAPPNDPPPARLLRLLRLENLGLALVALLAYQVSGGSWRLFALLFLLPDLSLLAYLVSPALGARGYNLAHNYLGPLLLAAGFWAAGQWSIAGATMGDPTGWHWALIWCAHIAIDRALGFGLKYPGGFADTHLGRLKGRRS